MSWEEAIYAHKRLPKFHINVQRDYKLHAWDWDEADSKQHAYMWLVRDATWIHVATNASSSFLFSCTCLLFFFFSSLAFLCSFYFLRFFFLVFFFFVIVVVFVVYWFSFRPLFLFRSNWHKHIKWAGASEKQDFIWLNIRSHSYDLKSTKGDLKTKTPLVLN